MKKTNKPDGAEVTRRMAIKAIGGVLSATTVGVLGCSTVRTTQNSGGATKAAASPPPTSDNDTIFALLAAWLLVSTNNTFANSFTACQLEQQAGIPYCWVQAALARANSVAAKPTYQAMQAEFQYFIKNVVPYTGPACPADVRTFQAITNVKPIVGTSEYPCSTPC